MFEINDFVFYGSEGVCRIDDIVSSPFSDVKTEGKYFVLHSLHGKTGTMFVPVAASDRLMRRIMSKSELGKLLSRMDSLPLIVESNLKQLKEKYSEAMRSGKPDEWVRVIKTVYDRTVNGRSNGRKVSDAERAFSENAKKYLYMEISTVLGIPEESVEKYITDYMENKAV